MPESKLSTVKNIQTDSRSTMIDMDKVKMRVDALMQLKNIFDKDDAVNPLADIAALQFMIEMIKANQNSKEATQAKRVGKQIASLVEEIPDSSMIPLKEAVKIAKCPELRIRAAYANGLLPGIKLSNKEGIRFKREDLIEWIKQGRKIRNEDKSIHRSSSSRNEIDGGNGSDSSPEDTEK